MTFFATVSRIAIVLIFSISGVSEAAWARSGTITREQTAVGTSRYATPVDAYRSDACLTLDKRTGQLVPCTKSGSGGSTGGGTTTTPPPAVTTAKPFDLFDAEQTEADFDADPESVLPNAYLLSQLSAIAYKPPSEAYQLADEMGLDSVEVIEEHFNSFWDTGGPGGASKVYVFYNDEAVFVAFEGSTWGWDNWGDWEDSNLDIEPHQKPEWGEVEKVACTPFFGCVTLVTDEVTIHNGFYDAMDLVYDQIVEEIEPLLDDGRRLWITGHSLGGAVAKLTAFRLTFEKGIPVQGVHVFGAPAVGDGLWAEVFDANMSNVHRWNLQGDPAHWVAHWPMFYHVGINNNLYTDGSIELDDDWFLQYAPNCAPGYGMLVVHMHYWPRMHEELSESHPDLMPLLPPSLEGASPGDDTCYGPGNSV